jgi:hypothetical protein
MRRQPASTRGTSWPIVTKREAGCGGRYWRATTKRAMRPTKPCGPDTPTLVSSSGSWPGATVATKPGTPRRARSKSSNIARGMPDVSGCTCGYLVCVLSRTTLHTSLRVQRHPAFPAPSFSRDDAPIEPGQIMPRECGSASSWATAGCLKHSMILASASPETPPAPRLAPASRPTHSAHMRDYRAHP